MAKPQQQFGPSPLQPGLFTVFVGAIILLVSYSLHVFYWTPTPRSADTPPGTFAEARARQHVHVLTEDIGLRSVSTPGLQKAHHYIWNFCQQLQHQVAGTDVTVQAQFENYTGETVWCSWYGCQQKRTRTMCSRVLLTCLTPQLPSMAVVGLGGGTVLCCSWA
eukprot:GHUV01029169.1.p1 GENE.GHUV01029169.1~~GHUV01029169.1.p1  ORF type:complete len:163 (+),score=33.75 GHUV01029169.1:200-688(+)